MEACRSPLGSPERVLSLFKPRGRQRRPKLPDGVRIYAVGDVHGRVDLLDEVFRRIDADRAAAPRDSDVVIFVGDYIDRGPSSRDVLDLLIARMHSNRTHKTILLKGNHESYLLEFLKDPSILREWRQYGGLPTLMSYGLHPSINPNDKEQWELPSELRSILPWTHQALLEALPKSLSSGDFFFAHAGVRPGVPLAEQKEEDLLWIRDEFLLCEDDFGKIVVHGHTPVPGPDIRPNRINIDTGAYATGRLTCIMIRNEDVVVI